MLNNKGNRIIDIKTGKYIFYSEYKGRFNISVQFNYNGKESLECVRSFNREEDAQNYMASLTDKLNAAHYQLDKSWYNQR